MYPGAGDPTIAAAAAWIGTGHTYDDLVYYALCSSISITDPDLLGELLRNAAASDDCAMDTAAYIAIGRAPKNPLVWMCAFSNPFETTFMDHVATSDGTRAHVTTHVGAYAHAFLTDFLMNREYTDPHLFFEFVAAAQFLVVHEPATVVVDCIFNSDAASRSANLETLRVLRTLFLRWATRGFDWKILVAVSAICAIFFNRPCSADQLTTCESSIPLLFAVAGVMRPCLYPRYVVDNMSDLVVRAIHTRQLSITAPAPATVSVAITAHRRFDDISQFRVRPVLAVESRGPSFILAPCALPPNTIPDDLDPRTELWDLIDPRHESMFDQAAYITAIIAPEYETITQACIVSADGRRYIRRVGPPSVCCSRISLPETAPDDVRVLFISWLCAWIKDPDAPVPVYLSVGPGGEDTVSLQIGNVYISTWPTQAQMDRATEWAKSILL